MKLPTFTAFRSRNYRLYVYGQSTSLIGTWMQRTAVSWLVFTMTRSTFMLGLTFFAGQFPSFLFSLFGGVISDRYNRYKVLLVTQVASMLQAALLATLVLLGHYTVWEILGLSTMLGVINAFDVPARQSLVYDMVDDKRDIPNALALNSSMVNLARLTGPAVAGIVLEKLGGGVCFLLNAASFLAVIASLLMMRLPAWLPLSNDKKLVTDLREGMTYLRQTPSIARVILMLMAMSLLVIPFATLLPYYAKVVYKGNASTFGYMNSFIAMGAVAGGLFLASVGTAANSKRILWVNSILFGLGLILFSHTPWFPLAMLFALLAGFGMMAQTTITNTIIQTTVTPAMRGRMISYFAMAYFGMQPLGSLLVGTVSQYIGAPNTILAEGLAALLIVGLFWKHLTEQTTR
ncbi:MAG: MFS transporter [Bacteroidota bacterium]|nr:MFS transporter [Bacteroidota bacterium]MDP4247750.1 MFS transporter [Bacteroidota bacterium]MDP4252810.1 MFS transporter [Bacteroidota bacterium]MDP4257717.1 MFS transporter [Bacteroidota bacterium]